MVTPRQLPEKRVSRSRYSYANTCLTSEFGRDIKRGYKLFPLRVSLAPSLRQVQLKSVSNSLSVVSAKARIFSGLSKIGAHH
jgi:hypothetical protein